ncbi:MAG: DUF4040 domain-containing protein [Leptolyngbyaceae cyanobacterium]
MFDSYMLAIAALLPLTATMVVTQKNPYHALVMRGMLGAVAALVYALFGAADVALTEALVGTMLSITLYAIAVRSSMTVRVGLLTEDASAIADDPESQTPQNQILTTLRQTLTKSHLRLESVVYPSPQTLQAAMAAKEIHGMLTATPTAAYPYQLTTRVPKLHQLLHGQLPAGAISLTPPPQPIKAPAPALSPSTDSCEVQS